MNEHQDNADQTGADAAAEAAEAPKKRRAPRKTAAAVAAPETMAPDTPGIPEAAQVVKKPRAPRKSAAVVEAPLPAESPVEPSPPVAADEAAASVPRPARAPRSRKKDVSAEPVSVAQDLAPAEAAPAVLNTVVAEPVTADAPTVPVEAVAAVEVSDAPGVTATAGAEESGSRRRERDRSRRRDRRGGREDGVAPVAAQGADMGEETFEEIVVVAGDDDDDLVDAGTLFAEVVSGDYDIEATPAADDEAADPGKRVLRPEPEAPKLHKVLAQAGIGSRREMEQLIQDGQVSVNGEAAHIGMRIAQGDQIRIAGRPIKVRIAPPPARVLAYHKEVGEVVTHHDPEGRPTVFRRLPRLHTGKWLSVGRLDINTEGLLLFTNSGDLANQLMHPRFGVEREYAVRVLGSLSTEQRTRLLDGVDIEGQKAAFKSIEDGGGEGINRWYRVVITEGRNREVRKLFDKVGLAVSRLIRIRYGTVVLPRGLKRGVWVELDDQDVRTIRNLAGGDQATIRTTPNEAPRGKKSQPGRGQERGERGGERSADRGGDRQERAGRGHEPRAERDPQAPRGKGAQHGGDRGMDRGDRQGGRSNGPGGAQPQNRPPRGPRQDGLPQGGGHGGNGGGNSGNGGGGGGRGPRAGGEDPLHIPNPLEQTFDKRFVSGSKRITTGFGRPTEEPGPGGEGGGNRKGGARQPDPMQTSVGYIGAEAYFTRPGGGNNKGRGGRRR